MTAISRLAEKQAYTVALSYRKGGERHSEKKQVETLAEASKAVRKFIDDFLLGSSTWTGGKVYVGRKQVARVSYNGRVWEPNDGAEIK